MIELKLVDVERAITLPSAVFDCPFNASLIHQVVVAYAAAARSGTRAQKSRGEVRASGRKPWKQKGTGRARAGSVASPLWRSGGVTFAAKPACYAQKVNRKMYRGAMKSIFSELVRSGRMLAVEQFVIEAPKTKLLAQKVAEFNRGRLLIVTANACPGLYRAARNLHNVQICDLPALNPRDCIRFDTVLMTAEVIKQIEEWLS